MVRPALRRVKSCDGFLRIGDSGRRPLNLSGRFEKNWPSPNRTTAMKFRLKAFGFHVLGSATALALVLGVLYFGWYRWPGWYLTGALRVALVMIGVDAVLGPLLTLIVANPLKPVRGLVRDIAIIVGVQVIALLYGATTLWQGRPLYYAFSVDRLQIVQASDLDSGEVALARAQNPSFTPRWYSLPRWTWAPLPDDEKLRTEILSSAVFGGTDVVQMPRFFKAWESGLPELRKQLKPVDRQMLFSKSQKTTLKERMSRSGFAPDQAITIFMTGRQSPVLAVFDPKTLQIRAILSADS